MPLPAGQIARGDTDVNAGKIGDPRVVNGRKMRMKEMWLRKVDRTGNPLGSRDYKFRHTAGRVRIRLAAG